MFSGLQCFKLPSVTNRGTVRSARLNLHAKAFLLEENGYEGNQIMETENKFSFLDRFKKKHPIFIQRKAIILLVLQLAMILWDYNTISDRMLSNI